MKTRTIRGWTIRGLRALVLGAALGVPASAAFCQSAIPNTAALPKRSFTKVGLFDLPVQMEEKDRANLKEIRLYVRTPSSDWQLSKTEPPSVTRFTYQVPQDGEYWFSLMTVDRAGSSTPKDVNQEPPMLRVVVDRLAPTVHVQPSLSAEGDLLLRCSVEDQNADISAVRTVLRTTAGDVPLETVVGQPGLFRLRGPDSLVQPIRISATDLAGNITTKEIAVRELLAAAGGPVAPAVTNATPAPTPVPAVANASPAPPPTPVSNPQNPQPARPIAPHEVQSVPTTTSFGQAVPAVGSQSDSTSHRLVSVPPGPLPIADSTMNQRVIAPAPQPIAPAPVATNGNRQLINTTKASMEYRIEQIGPSGVGRVDIYLTSDQGQTWHRRGEDTDRRSPAEIELPGEGVFGVRLVVSNGNGFGGTPPRRGESPDCTIEVDSTPPFVQLRPIELVPQTSSLEIRWNASDKNLGAEPISLYFRAKADAPWQVVARNVKNDGTYRWNFPREAGSYFFFKVEATDQAGNVGIAETTNPVVLDMTEPRASILSISGLGPRGTP